MSKGWKERKTRGVKAFLVARLLTSAYVYLSSHRVREHPASSAAIKLLFLTVTGVLCRVINHDLILGTDHVLD